MKKTMEVYAIDTTGGQITGMEAIRGEIPAWLAAVEAAEHAIRWTVEN